MTMPIVMTCLATSEGLANNHQQAAGININEPQATPEALHADPVATIDTKTYNMINFIGIL
ncbi:hypothetical protein KTH71_00005 [Acinetobacter sp. WU_MDCI_Axc73]|nr:hypothetical protein [Acinetobacter sp. WU_MDCI_Axc73]